MYFRSISINLLIMALLFCITSPLAAFSQDLREDHSSGLVDELVALLQPNSYHELGNIKEAERLIEEIGPKGQHQVLHILTRALTNRLPIEQYPQIENYLNDVIRLLIKVAGSERGAVYSLAKLAFSNDTERRIRTVSIALPVLRKWVGHRNRDSINSLLNFMAQTDPNPGVRFRAALQSQDFRVGFTRSDPSSVDDPNMQVIPSRIPLRMNQSRANESKDEPVSSIDEDPFSKGDHFLWYWGDNSVRRKIIQDANKRGRREINW